MHEIGRIASEYPLAAIGAAVVALVVFVFLLKKLVKAALILLIIAFAVGALLYVQYPDKRPANLNEALEKGQELIDKGKEVYEKGKAVLDKGIDTGKGVIDKGKGAAEEIGKKIGGEKETGTRQPPGGK